MDNNTKSKREMYYDLLKLRVGNQDEIDRLKRELSFCYSPKNRVLLDEKVRYDQSLKSELIQLDGEILELLGFKLNNNGKTICRI